MFEWNTWVYTVYGNVPLCVHVLVCVGVCVCGCVWVCVAAGTHVWSVVAGWLEPGGGGT